MLESIYGHLHSYSSLLNLNVFYCNDHNDIRYVFRSFTLILFSSKRYIRDCELWNSVFSQFTPDLSGECVVESLAFCVVFCIFVVCLLTIILSVSLQWFLECLYYIFTDFHIFLIIFGFSLMLLFLEIYVYSTYAFILYKSIHSYLLCWNRNVRLM